MDFLLGSIVAISCIYIANKFISRKSEDRPPIRIRFSQSHKFDLTYGSYLAFMNQISQYKDTQSFAYKRGQETRIVIIENEAYWIQDGMLYVGEWNEALAEVNQESKKRVDTMVLDKVELKKIIYIVEKLTEGTDRDPRNPGNKDF